MLQNVNSEKPYLHHQMNHTLIHFFSKVILGIQAMICLIFLKFALVEGEYKPVLGIPMFVLFSFILHKTVLQSKAIRGDPTGFDIYDKGEWKPHFWSDVITIEYPFWGFNPLVPVLQIRTKQGDIFLFFCTKNTKKTIQSFLKATQE